MKFSRMKMKALMAYLGEQFGVDPEQIKNLNIESFVESAIKVEAGEIKTLRPEVKIFKKLGKILKFQKKLETIVPTGKMGTQSP